LVEVPDNVRQDLQIVPVEQADKAIKQSLVGKTKK